MSDEIQPPKEEKEAEAEEKEKEEKEERKEEKEEKEESRLVRPRSAVDEPAVSIPKKKRKLLSFEEEAPAEWQLKGKAKRETKEPQRKGSIEEQLRQQYLVEVEKLKEELFEVEYSYWDGANVVKKLRRKKKDTVLELLQVCRLELIQNFQNLVGVEPKELLFVIKDFIAPHNLAIYDIEALELKTATYDPLLNLRQVKIKKEGKEVKLSVNMDGPIRIIERTRYEKNRTVFPFVNWQTLNLQ